MRRTARCQCGELEICCDGEPVAVSLCHCLACQRRTGSVFGVGAFFARARVRFAKGSATRFSRGSDSGAQVIFSFCGICGSTVWWEPERLPTMIGVAVGAFADPGFPAPGQATWDACRHPWVELPAGVASFASGRGRP